MKELYALKLDKRRKLVVFHGDITKEDSEVIVNPANSYLQHGGGVAGAIVRRGGRIIQDESNKIGYVPVGNVALTSAGSLNAKYVIHAVGPRWGEGDEDKKLENAVRNALLKGSELNIKTIAFPAISSGIFGFPKKRCAEILITTTVSFFKNNPDSSIEEVHFTNIDEETSTIFENELRNVDLTYKKQ